MGKGLWIGLGLLCTAVGLSGYGLYRLATRYYDFGAASGELPQAVADYRRAGLPFLASELIPKTTKPNAAPAIRAALAALPNKKAATRVTDELKKTDAKADAALAPYAKPLALLEAVRDRSNVDFGRDWDLGIAVRLPEYGYMKTLARAAVLRAVRSAQKGNDAAALSDLTLARQLGLWAGQEPGLISPLVRFSLEMIALDGAELCLVATVRHPERIARFARWLAGAPPLPDFRLALRGESFFGVTTARNLVLLGGLRSLLDAEDDEMAIRVDPRRLHRRGIPSSETARAYLARHLQLWTEAFRTTDGFRNSPEAMGRQLDAIFARAGDQKGLSFALDRALASEYRPAGESVTRLEARRAVEAGFAEGLTTHALTGRWPTRVAGIDPFTGGPLKVKQGAQGFRVWSVGRDRKDDGGVLRREAPKRSGATYDEVAVYPPVPR